MTNLRLSALAVEAIEHASLTTGVSRRLIHMPSRNDVPARNARAVAMDHMKMQGASVDEISRAFTCDVKTVRSSIKLARK